MQNLPANIYSVAAVREIDRVAIEDNGIPGYTLMKRAGAAAVSAARSRFPSAARWQVICGAGNNGDAATAYKDFVAAGGAVMLWAGLLDAKADLLVDAILGSGLERVVAGEFADAVAAINAHPAPRWILRPASMGTRAR